MSEYWATMDSTPQAKTEGPPHPAIYVEQGKPIALPATAGEPQGTLWVKECGKSERRL